MPSNICRYLTALIAEGSFSKAAQRLGISQPSLSQFLVRLETDAQTELVDRSAKPLKLTAAGALFLRTEQQVDLLRETAAKQMLDIKGGVRGHVTVGASDYRETFFLAEVLPVFHRLYPLIEVSLTEGRTKKLEQMALEGAVDFSLVITPPFIRARSPPLNFIKSESLSPFRKSTALPNSILPRQAKNSRSLTSMISTVSLSSKSRKDSKWMCFSESSAG